MTQNRSVHAEADTDSETEKSRSDEGITPSDEGPDRAPSGIQAPIRALKRAYAALTA